MNNMSAMATRTLVETPTPAGTASLPPTSGTATKPVAAVQRPRYVLADSGGDTGCGPTATQNMEGLTSLTFPRLAISPACTSS